MQNSGLLTGEFPLPELFEKRMEKLLGEEYRDFRASYDRKPVCSLRINPLKKGLDPERYKAVLEKVRIFEQEPVPWAENGYYYQESPIEEADGCRPGRHPYHEMGLYYIQEASAMAPAALLEAKPGERILDLCAAPGGKSTQIAAGMNQQGLLVSNEIHGTRAKILARNIERMGIANAVVLNEDSGKLAERFPGFFHRILVDAPCSGEGMFRKHPESRMQWSPENSKLCARRQAEIMDHAAQMLMPGGRMVYSTCTFAPEENEQTVEQFLKRHPEFSLSHSRRLWPHLLRGEGHFAAVLEKEGSFRLSEPVSNSGEKKKKRRTRAGEKGLDAARKEALCKFAEEMLVPKMRWLAEEPEGLIMQGEQVYRLPEGMPGLSGLAVLRAGLHIGTFKRDRFEPAHALALFLGGSEVLRKTGLAEEEMIRYLRGETLSPDAPKGWTLVCMDGFSAGWGKMAGGMLKNHYPKGLRR